MFLFFLLFFDLFSSLFSFQTKKTGNTIPNTARLYTTYSFFVSRYLFPATGSTNVNCFWTKATTAVYYHPPWPGIM